jgi:hypothetical protein
MLDAALALPSIAASHRRVGSTPASERGHRQWVREELAAEHQRGQFSTGVSPDLIRVGACPRYAIDRIAGASDMALFLAILSRHACAYR